MPPFAEPSSFVSTTPVTPTASAKSRACWSAVLAGRRVDHEQRLVRRALEAAGDHAPHLRRARPSGSSACAAGRRCRRSRRRRPRRPRRRRPRPGRRRARRRRSARPARFAHTSSCSSAAARNVSAAPSVTSRPCSRSFCASLPIVVVLPVPLTPTTRITDGLVRDVEPRRLAEQRRDLLGERRRRGRRAPPRASSRRTSSAVARTPTSAVEQRLLEPLPRRRVLRVERRDGDLLGQRTAAARERVAQARRRTRARVDLRLVRPLGVAEELCPAPRHGGNASYARRACRSPPDSGAGRRRVGVELVDALAGRRRLRSADVADAVAPRSAPAATGARADLRSIASGGCRGDVGSSRARDVALGTAAPSAGRAGARAAAAASASAARARPSAASGRRGDLVVLRQAARDDLRDAVAAHRDAVEDVGGLHRPLLVRDRR